MWFLTVFRCMNMLWGWIYRWIHAAVIRLKILTQSRPPKESNVYEGVVILRAILLEVQRTYIHIQIHSQFVNTMELPNNIVPEGHKIIDSFYPSTNWSRLMNAIFTYIRDVLHFQFIEVISPTRTTDRDIHDRSFFVHPFVAWTTYRLLKLCNVTEVEMVWFTLIGFVYQ